MPDIDQRINPQVREIVIGTRSLRKIKIYPLSLRDQLELNDLISVTLSNFFKMEEAGGMVSQDSLIAFVGFAFNLVKENLSKVLGKITDEDGEKLMEEITNDQAIEIAELVVEMNFSKVTDMVKKLMSRLPTTAEVATPSPSEKLSLRSAKPTPTDSKTSTVKGSKKAG